jgi:tRNA A37 threonylcarbamoyladenosine dehydratase
MDPSYLNRFAGVGRLYGKAGLEHLKESHFMVIGLGGVGSWTVEALARSGVGQLTLVDGDAVCISNTNRQIHALAGNEGTNKTAVMANRVKAINPDIKIKEITRFISRTNPAELLSEFKGVVIDAIDSLSPKCALINEVRKQQLKIVTVGGCAGRLDGTRIKVTDLTAFIVMTL